MTDPSPPTHQADTVNDEVKRLAFVWASCCVSPIVYLGIAWFIIHRVKKGEGYFPVSAETYSQVLIGLVLSIIFLQCLHVFLKRRFVPVLAASLNESPEFFSRALTRRTFILIFLSEMAVFAGFIIALIQGDLAVVFGTGMAAMFLYAQSHPRSALPQPI